MSRTRVIVLAALVVAAVAAGWMWKGRAAKAPKYRFAAVERGSIESVVSATGTVRPVVQVEVGSQVSGTVDRVYADFNSQVRSGQVLLQLDPASFRARAVQSEAAVSKAQAAVKDAERVLRRARELVSQNFISQAEVEGNEVALEQRQAELKQARAQLQVAQVDLANTTIRSPIDGVVIARAIDRGQTVAASLQAPKLFVIANDLTRMQVETRIDEADIGRITPGLPVTFTVDAFPDAMFKGEVAQVRLEPIVEQGVVTYTTVIHTGNPDLKLRPGMTANVTVRVEQRDDVLKVAAAALRFKPPMPPGGRGGPDAQGRRAVAAAEGRAGGAGAGGAAGTGGGAAGSMTSGGGAGSGERAAAAGAGARRGRSGAGGAGRAADANGVPASLEPSESAYKPGAVYVLRAGKLERIPVMTGLTDGGSFEIRTDQLKPGDEVVVSIESTQRANNMQPPPGMGGPQFRGGRGGGGGRGGR